MNQIFEVFTFIYFTPASAETSAAETSAEIWEQELRHEILKYLLRHEQQN